MNKIRLVGTRKSLKQTAVWLQEFNLNRLLIRNQWAYLKSCF